MSANEEPMASSVTTEELNPSDVPKDESISPHLTQRGSAKSLNDPDNTNGHSQEVDEGSTNNDTSNGGADSKGTAVAVSTAAEASTTPGDPATAVPAEGDANRRNIFGMHHHQNSLEFASNMIQTTKYSVIPIFLDFFLWKMLYEQFQRMANVYFLFISILQGLPFGLSPTGRWTTAFTLAIVLTFSMCKSAYEDINRYKKDKEVNNRVAYVLRVIDGQGTWVAVPYTEVKVGDIVRVMNVEDKHGNRNNDLPCDIALLTTSDPEGVAYVETANLDGETNLKARRCLEQTKIVVDTFVHEKDAPTPADSQSLVGGHTPSIGSMNASGMSGATPPMNMANPINSSGSMFLQDSMAEGGAPRKVMSPKRHSEEVAKVAADFYGAIRLETEQPNGSLYTFNGNLFLPDGSSLSLSPDQMMYRGCLLRKVPWAIGVAIFTGKETKVMMNAKKPPYKQSRVEATVNRLLLAVLALQLTLVIVCTIGIRVSDNSMWYLQNNDENADLRAFLGFLTFIILFNNFIPISLYVSLEAIKFFQGVMMEQDLCMYYAPKDMRTATKTTSLNEELGQVNFVFSDKTGTLTRNVMTFMKFCIDGHIYGTGTTEIGRAAAKRQGKEVLDDRPEEVQNSIFPFWDTRCNNNRWEQLPEAEKIRELFLLLATCHTVVLDHGKYEAESPDEEALVRAAKHFGYNFLNRTSDAIKLHVGSAGVEEKFKILEIIEFNSDRKRMSTLVMTPEGEVKLMMKGADNVIFARLRDGTANLKETKASLAQFGDEGLRTLVLCQRTLEPAEFEPWLKDYRAAKSIIGDNDRRAALMDKLAAEIEVNMELVGCTAIEDKLQDGVPAAIESIRKADVRVWMLTGDKVETAINIGFACALLHDKMEITQLVEMNSDEEVFGALDKCGKVEGEKSVVIDGHTLAFIMKSLELSDRFYDVTKDCTSVVCSRVSPKQKADVVELVRLRATDAVSLAIGDGANDVPMIQAAHVGVGISGMEGQQAANSADYAIGQFKYLHRLLMIHGRANYYRLSEVINYSFYKNAVLILTQFYYCLFNNFTGQSLYEQWSLALYNVSWTFFPIVIFGIFDRNVLNTDNIHKLPQLYRPGIVNELLNIPRFIAWLSSAVVHSLVCFFVVMFGWGAFLRGDGSTFGLDGSGVTLYTCVIVLANCKLALHVSSFTWLHHLTIWGSIAAWFLFLPIYGVFPSTFNTTMYRILDNVGFQVAPWLFFLLSTMMALSPDFMIKYARLRIIPLRLMSLVHKVQLWDSKDSMAATRQPLEVRKHDGFRRKDVVGGEELGNLFEEYIDDDVMVDPSQDFLMQFRDEDLETEFIDAYLGDLFRYKLGLGMCSIASLVLVGSVAASDESEPLEMYMWGLFALASWICTVLVLCYKGIKEQLHPVMLLLILIAFSGMTIGNLVAAQRDPETHPITLGLILLGLLTVIRPPLLHAIHYTVIAFFCYIVWYQGFRVKQWEQTEFAVRFMELLIVSVTALFSLQSSEQFMRRMFVSQMQVKQSLKAAAAEEARSLRLLANVLPSAIVKEVRTNKRQLSEFSVTYDEASMLNSDVVKFTAFSSTKEPHVVVEMLNRMFTKFDTHAAELGVEKIKTIGDAYVCAAGIPIPDEFHVQKIIAMGLRMVDSIGELNSEGLSTLRDLNIQIRIGCATGPVMSGVVGMQKVCYDVFGSTANMSELMEQQGRPNRVRVTPEVMRVMESNTNFKFEEIDGGLFVVGGEKGVPRSSNSDALVPVTAVERQDIYAFLEDQDQDRREIIRTWAGFQGEMSSAALNFTEMDIAEVEFKIYLHHLAHSRFFNEMTQGAILFLLCGVLLALHLQEVSNFVMLLFLILGVIHLSIVIVAKVIAYKNAPHVDTDGDSDNEGEREMDDLDRRLTRGRSSLSPGALSNRNDDTDSAVAREHEEEAPTCTPIRAVMVVSVVFAFMAPILTLLAADTQTTRDEFGFHCNTSMNFTGFNASTDTLPKCVVDNDEIGTVSAFVILAATIYALNLFHARMPMKYAYAVVTFIAISIVFFIAMGVMRKFDPFTDGGDYFAVFLCFVLSVFSTYNTEKSVRRAFAAAKNVVYQNAEVQSAVSLCDKLLNNVLPASIVKRMKAANGEQIVDEVPEASVCFLYTEGLLDKVGNDDSTASEFIDNVNQFLVLLDTLTVRHQVEKIKTTPFLVVCGCPVPFEDHALQISLFARDVISSVKTFNQEYGTDIKVKIGIHSGKVTAGVLGSTKFLYDVFGDTVNFASRLTSSAEWGTVQLSEVARNLVHEHFRVISRGKMELKGKGEQDIFMLDVEDGSRNDMTIRDLERSKSPGRTPNAGPLDLMPPNHSALSIESDH